MTQEQVIIEPMTIRHYDEVMALWKESENVGLSSADERDSIKSYLCRNPGMSFVARENNHIIGAALCGHDGRRGYLHHLAVAESSRKRGIGRELVEMCMRSLRDEGIRKCHLFVFHGNVRGKAFWKSIGWTLRLDIQGIVTIGEASGS